MLEVRVDWRTREVRELLAKLQQPRANKALSVAVNDSARQVERLAERIVAKASGLARKDTAPAIVIRPFSKPSTLSATVLGRGAPIALYKFKARQTRKGVSASAWGTRRVYPGTFIATMKSGHTGVFRRTGPKRFPIKELWGAGIAKTMAQDAVLEALRVEAQDRLLVNVTRQLKRYAFRN